MRIGITFDLQEDYLAKGFSEEETAEFDQLETIDSIDDALINMGFETERIGDVRNLAKKLTEGNTWDLVFNICEGMYGFAREAQVPALLDAYLIPYVFSDPLILALTLHKGMTKRVIRDLGIRTPDFAVVEQEDDFNQINLRYPLFIKPIAEGTSKGISSISKIDNEQDLRLHCLTLMNQFRQPVLIEEYLPNREFTIGIVGTGRKARAIGTMEIIQKGSYYNQAYSYYVKENYEELVEYHKVDGNLAVQCEDIALRIWQGLGCRDAGRVDLKMDINKILNFIEVNPLAGLHPIRSDLVILAKIHGITYQKLIEIIVESTLERVGKRIERVGL